MDSATKVGHKILVEIKNKGCLELFTVQYKSLLLRY